MSESEKYESRNIQGTETWRTEDMIVKWVKELTSIVDRHNESLIKLLDLTEKLEKRLDALENKGSEVKDE